MAYDGTIRLDTGIDDKGITDALGKLGGVVAAGAATALAALTSMGAAAIKVGSDFEAAMSKVEAISGSSGKEMQALTDIAKEMGEKTKSSATESAEALTYMAMAGWKTEQMISGLPGIMNLAAASGEDLGLVSDIVTDALTGFGMAAEESGHFADVLAAASNNANTNVSLLGESFKYVAPVAGALGYSVEDTSVALGLMANSGIKASQAGTALRTLLTNMVKPTDQMAAAMTDLGIELTNMDGTMKPLSQVMVEMRTSFDGLTESERAMYAATLAGKEGMSGLLAIVNASEEDFNKLTVAINNADGTAQKMADTMNNNLQGKMVLLGSALEGVGIKLYDSFKEPLKDAVDSAIVSVGRLSTELSSPKMQSALDTLADGFADLTKGAADLAVKAIPVLVSGFALVAENSDALAAVTLTVVSAFGAYKIITSVTGWMSAMDAALVLLANTQNVTAVATLATNGALSLSQIVYAALTGQIGLAAAAQAAWNLVWAANPIGVTITIVAALVAGLILLRNALEDTTSVTDEFNDELDALETKMDGLAEACKDSAEAHQKNIDSIESESIASKNLADKVTQLASIENKSVADKLRLKQTVDLLNQSVSGLNLVYDEQNDKLSMNADQIYKVVEAQKERLLQQAREERALELAKEQADAEYALAQAMIAREDAAIKLAEAQAQLDRVLAGGTVFALEHTQGYKDAEAAVRDWSVALADAEQAEASAQEQVETTTQSFDAAADAMVGAGIAAEESADKMEESFGAAGSAIEQFTSVSRENIVAFLESMGFVDDALEEQIDALESYEQQTTDMWGRINEAAKVSIDEMIANLEYNSAAVEQWSLDLEALAKRGIDHGLIETLRAAGPEARVSIADLVNASDSELARLEGAFEKGGQAAVNALLREMGSGNLAMPIDEALGEAASAVASNTALETSMEDKGSKSKEALATGIENANFSESGDKAMENTAQGVTDSTHVEDAVTEKTTAVREHSDAEVEGNSFQEVGDSIAENTADGIKDSTAVEDAATDLIQEVRSIADSEALAAGFDNVGYSIAEGIASGIHSGVSVVTSAVQSIIDAALAAARTAADSHSPARRFIPLGEDIDAGVAVGMGLNGLTPQASAQLMQDAHAAANSMQAQLGATYSSFVTHNNTTTTQSGGNVTFEDGAIRVEGAPVSNDLDAERVMRKAAEKTAKAGRWKGVFNPA